MEVVVEETLVVTVICVFVVGLSTKRALGQAKSVGAFQSALFRWGKVRNKDSSRRLL